MHPKYNSNLDFMPEEITERINIHVTKMRLKLFFSLFFCIGLVNDRPEFDVQLRYVAIPQSFPIKDTEEIFNPETIQSLIELGLKMGADPASWKTDALRPGAPFDKKNDRKLTSEL